MHNIGEVFMTSQGTSMDTPVLSTRHLSKRYGSFVAVDDVELTVFPGEVFGFLGPNGAGKTTTIAMILGLLHPTSGDITIFEQPVTPSRPQALRRVGSLVGDAGMVPILSGRQNLCLLAHLHRGIDRQRIDDVLDQVGLTHAADRPFRSYSTGMKQRLGLGAALLHHPALLILDEPTNGLDPAGMREMRDLLRALAGDGMTVFLSSHLLHEVQQVCDRVAVLNRGKMVAQGRVDELLGDEQLVRVRVASPMEGAEVLRSLDGATHVRPDGAFVEIIGVPSEAVVLHLVEHGLVPSEVARGRADLEQLFFELTGPVLEEVA
jgi:ABC-type multidrug transport system ATPase subunit